MFNNKHNVTKISNLVISNWGGGCTTTPSPNTESGTRTKFLSVVSVKTVLLSIYLSLLYLNTNISKEQWCFSIVENIKQ